MNINFIKKILIKYKEIILYGVFGVGATLINIISFFLLDSLFGVNMLISNVIAWILAFIFAFITNKLFVFESKSWENRHAFKEFIDFFIARIATLFIDMFLMWLFVDFLSLNSLLSKIVVNVIVIILNYIASKFWIFKKKKTMRKT